MVPDRHAKRGGVCRAPSHAAAPTLHEVRSLLLQPVCRHMCRECGVCVSWLCARAEGLSARSESATRGVVCGVSHARGERGSIWTCAFRHDARVLYSRETRTRGPHTGCALSLVKQGRREYDEEYAAPCVDVSMHERCAAARPGVGEAHGPGRPRPPARRATGVWRGVFTFLLVLLACAVARAASSRHLRGCNGTAEKMACA
jgi:hypothetical protein